MPLKPVDKTEVESRVMSDTERSRSPPNQNGGNTNRHEKSLGLLTSRFVDLLQGAEDGILDLKKVLLVCIKSWLPCTHQLWG